MADAALLRVVTLNVLGPANPDWQRRSRLIAATLAELAPDIVALQEVPARRIADTSALLGPEYTVHPFSRTADDGIGGILACRTEADVVAELDQRHGLSPLPWSATLLVRCSTPIGPVLVAHHKPSWQFGAEVEREQQALAAVRHLEERASDVGHVVVLGDFDATPDASSLQFWRGRRSLNGVSACYQDAWETLHGDDAGHTFSARNPLVLAGEVATAVSRRIDYILVRSGDHGPTVQVRDCRLVLDQPVDGVWASDHFGVLADLSLPDHPPGTWRHTARGGLRRQAAGTDVGA
jgi:endonuclease/exonuclease/phosphatase family metal-dependent hydrolase